MNIQVERLWFTDKSTIGTLSINGANECFTLEDQVREIPGEPVENWKVPGQTAIPKGTYNVVMTFSNRFQRTLPLLEDVPGFDGIRIHSGNTDKDTEGCILVGRYKTQDAIQESRIALGALLQSIERALKDGEKITLEIA